MDTGTQTRTGKVQHNAEAGTGVMTGLLRTAGCHQEPERGMKELPWSFGKEPTLLTPCLWKLRLQNYERINFCGFEATQFVVHPHGRYETCPHFHWERAHLRPETLTSACSHWAGQGSP
jgi:hypothetical protein